MKILPLGIILIVLAIFLSVNSLSWSQELEISVLEGGVDTLDFGNIRSLDEAGNPQFVSVVRRVRVRVNNPTTNRYQVIQRLEEPVMNQKGEILKKNILKFYVYGSGHKGSLEPTSQEGISVGDRIIFTSDDAGSDAEFFINYLLETKDVLSAGRYHSNIAYLLTER